jgi:hypothetical protein
VVAVRVESDHVFMVERIEVKDSGIEAPDS